MIVLDSRFVGWDLGMNGAITERYLVLYTYGGEAVIPVQAGQFLDNAESY